MSEPTPTPTPDEIDAAVDVLLGLTVQQANAKIAERRNVHFQKAEDAKTHPMVGFELPADEWAALKANLMDGGGVEDDRDLAKKLLQAMFDNDQKKFWPYVVQLVKARAKITGRMQALPHGGTSWSGVGPT